MRIEVGKRYWLRCGGVSAVVTASRNDVDSSYRYSTNGMSYTEDGLVSALGGPFDLVAEYTGPELKMPRPLAVGKRYVTSYGWVTAPLKQVQGLYANCGVAETRWIDTPALVREYLGKDDPINKEI